MVKKIVQNKTRKYLILGVTILLIYLAYGVGSIYGVIIGLQIMQEKQNSTICELLMETNENIEIGYRWNTETPNKQEEICIMSRDAKYYQEMKCPYGTFVTFGERQMNELEKIAYLPQKIMFYPALRCW